MQKRNLKLAMAVAAGSLLPFGAQAAEPLKEAQDGSWLSISGTVTHVDPERFRLDYGDGSLTVEMDDWDTYGDAYVLRDGDRVTVYGAVDKNTYTTDTLEASSVYVEGLNTYFYASPADEEAVGRWAVDTPIVLTEMTLIGRVESVNELTDTFTVDAGAMEVEVDTSPMVYDPLDEAGFQQIEVGDRVSVEGDIDETLFGDQQVRAETIVTLDDADL